MKKLITLFIILLIITFFIGYYSGLTKPDNKTEPSEWITVDTLHMQDTVIWVGNEEQYRKLTVHSYFPQEYKTITIRLIKK